MDPTDRAIKGFYCICFTLPYIFVIEPGATATSEKNNLLVPHGQ